MQKTEELRLDKIRIDGGTQTRAALNMATVKEYAEDMENGATFPPLGVVFDGEVYWLWDGFHRWHGYRAAGIAEAECIVTEGSQEDALRLALAANAAHGLQRTSADKKAALRLCLAHPVWGKESDGLVAERCAVSVRFVGKWRTDLQPTHRAEAEARVGRDGKTYKLPAKPAPVEREPGDESEPGGADPIPAEAEPVANTAVSELFNKKKPGTKGRGTAFDDSEFFRVYGTLVRLVQSRAEVLKCVNSPDHRRTCAALDELLSSYEGWQKRRAA